MFGLFFFLIPHFILMHTWFKNHLYICGYKCFPRKIYRFSFCHILYTFHLYQKTLLHPKYLLLLLKYKVSTVVWNTAISLSVSSTFFILTEKLVPLAEGEVLSTFTLSPAHSASLHRTEFSLPVDCGLCWTRACRFRSSLWFSCTPTLFLLSHYKNVFLFFSL